MIISKKWKYIFVALPFSASEAISKELIELYDGEPLLWKHANITDLKKLDFDMSDYFVFAVKRNPVDIAFSHYNKMLTNAHGVFTEPKYFRENGGWVSKRSRRVAHEVRSQKLEFTDYLKIQYKTPYDFVFSMNKPYLHGVIDFTKLADSFEEVLKRMGIKPVRKLQVVNKTRKIAEVPPSHSEVVMRVFGPYLYCNDFEVGGGMWTGFFRRIVYKIIQPLRFYRWKKIDRDMRSRAINDYEYLNG